MWKHSFLFAKKSTFQRKKQYSFTRILNKKYINRYFNIINKKQKLANSDNVCYIFVEANRFAEI